MLAQDAEGSRQVQTALVAARSEDVLIALASELHGHVAKAMRCPHANHVLQKCISLMRPQALQFIVDELLAREGLASQAARHRYACRIVQQLLRKCGAAQASVLAEALLRDAVALACHSFGNYTIKQLLELGTEDQRYRAVRAIERNMGAICRSTHGGSVVAAAMQHAAPEDQLWLARAALQEPEVLACLAQGRHGDSTVLRMLQALSSQERARSCTKLVSSMAALGASGRAVAEYLE